MIRLTLSIAGIVMIATSILTLWLVPMMTTFRDKALSQGEVLGMMQSMLPQHFQTFGDGKLIFYLESVSPIHKSDGLEGVFIAERPTGISNTEKGWALITAEKAEIKQGETDGHLYLILKEGHRYQGIPGAANYSTIDFKEYGRSIMPVESQTTKGDSLRAKKTWELFSSVDPEDAAELQWRLSLPLTVPILALIAVPLAYVRPRQGRFAKFLPALVIYIIYYNLFTVCRRWVASGVLPSYLGVWWIHLIFLFVGLGLIGKETGWFRRKT
jgi:lipopolysaccharide export system permease protein